MNLNIIPTKKMSNPTALKNSFKTPEGLYHADLKIPKHAVNRGVKPLYHKPRSQLLSTCIDLVDHSFTSSQQQQQQQVSPLPSSSSLNEALTDSLNNKKRGTITTPPPPPPYSSSSSSSSSTPRSAAARGSSSSSTSNNQNNNNNTFTFDPYGVFLSFNTHDNKVFCYNMMHMLNEKDFGNPVDRLSCDVLPTCHKINASEISKSKLDILIGFATGDIVIHSAITKENLMFNRQTCVDKSPVKRVAWCPLDPGKFVVAHASGNLYMYDRTLQEHAALSVTPTHLKQFEKQQHQHQQQQQKQVFYRQDNLYESSSSSSSSSSLSTSSSLKQMYFYVRALNSNVNPIARYHLSYNQPINDIQFSPDGQHLAVACNDGYLRVISPQSGKLIVSFRSYYGAFTCCCWSPDGKYIVTGGEDDMISVFDFKNKCIIARGIGHSSFVSAVIFDPVECNDEQYRVLSVGDDCKLILWNIDKITNSCGDVSGAVNIYSDQKTENHSTNSSNNNSSTSSSGGGGGVIVPSQPWNDVPTFDPIRIHRAHHEPIRDLAVFDLGIVTVCNRNVIKFWVRPKAMEEDQMQQATITANTNLDASSATASSLLESEMETAKTTTTEALSNQTAAQSDYNNNNEDGVQDGALVYKVDDYV